MFARSRPLSQASAAQSSGFYGGVPQHWMLDWPTPFPLIIAAGSGTRLTDLDGHDLIDLCLGDTGAMFGHGAHALFAAFADGGSSGLTTMLPSQEAAFVSQRLAELFGLPFWQVTLSASDANRFALRAARAVTGRRKVLVFDGCYHGAVDEAGVMLDESLPGAPMVQKPSLWGQVHDLTQCVVCVPFNDVGALEIALENRDIACVMTEPALTNCGIVPPEPGFMQAVRDLTRETSTLLLIDETHTLSTGLGGWTRTFGLEPDILVAGKAIAGGVPCGVWGFTETFRQGLDQVRARLPLGHSGVGTTLAGSAFQMRALAATLGQTMSQDTYDRMIAGATRLEAEINAAIADFDLPWCVVRLGARLETIFSPEVPTNAAHMRKTFNPALEAALHLGLINRGFLVTPFHNMLLAGPDLPSDAPTRYGLALRSILSELSHPRRSLHVV
jgi:glutamate-1-semialdehyde 2,1-aminomutase